MKVSFTQPPTIDGWSLSYTARNASGEPLPVNSIVDVIQVFTTEPEVKMVQEIRTNMPPDELPPESTYGSWVDVDSSLGDGTYSVYVMLDDEGTDGPTARMVIDVESGSVVSQRAD